MKRTALLASLALAFAAPAFAQDAPQNAPVADQPTADAQATADADAMPMPAKATAGAHSTTRYHGAHRYPMKSRGRAGDPAIVDHSADTLIVEPTHSSGTVMGTP